MSGTFTNLLYHIVFCTKNRDNMINDELKPGLYDYIGGVIRGEGGTLIEIGGTTNHVHIATKFKPVIAVSEMLRKIKAGSSKWINESPNKLGRFSWQDGYGAFSVSESQLPSIVSYIRKQKEHHRTKTFKEEFVEFLNRHGIEYDAKYIWD